MTGCISITEPEQEGILKRYFGCSFLKTFKKDKVFSTNGEVE